jgi:uncharacterized membrane protein YagU involved in acid resistance
MEQTLSTRILIPDVKLSQLPELVKSELLMSSPSKQEIFIKLYLEKSKSLVLAYLCLMPIVLSFHYGILNQWPKQILFWITGGGMLVWWLIDLIRLPAIVKNHNATVALELWEEISEIGEGPVEGLF